MIPEETILVQYGELPLKWMSFARSARQECFAYHWHNRLELLYVVSGSLQATVGTETVVARAGELICVRPRCPHCGIAGEDGVAYHVIMFELAAMADSLPATAGAIRPLLKGTLRPHTLVNDAAVREDVRELIEEYRSAAPSALLLEGQMYRLLGHLLARHTDTAFVPHPADERFRQVLDYLEEHYAEWPSAADLAQRFHYEESYLCRCFRRQTGLTVTEYGHVLRLNKAQQLLRDTNDPIDAIRARCGFENASYFNRRFRRQFGMSPRQYRCACDLPKPESAEKSD